MSFLWTPSSPFPEGGYGYGVCWSPELELAVLVGYTGYQNLPGADPAPLSLATSPDGLSWTPGGDPFSTLGTGLTGTVEPDWGSIVTDYFPDGDYYVVRDDAAWDWAALSTPPGPFQTNVFRAGYQWYTFDHTPVTNVTGASEPTWTGTTVVDGTVTWHRSQNYTAWVGDAVPTTGMVTPTSGGGPLDYFYTGSVGRYGIGLGVCWSPGLGKFVAVGASNDSEAIHVATSDDGMAWTPHGSIFDPGTGAFDTAAANGVCWSPELELFVAVGYESPAYANSIATSPDGETWTVGGNPFGTDGVGTAVCWSSEHGLFVAVGYGNFGGVATSADGFDWTLQTGNPISDGGIYGVCWSPELELFVAVGQSADSTVSVMTSDDDGVTWAGHGNPLDPDNFGQGYGVTWSPELGIFLMTGYGTSQVASSEDGVSWTTQGQPFEDSGSGYAVSWAPALGRFVLAGYTSSNLVQAVRGPEIPPPPPTPCTPGVLYGALQDYGGDSDASGLYTIDPETGEATLVAPFVLPYEFTGLAVDPTDLVLYGATSTYSPVSPDSLFKIDSVTGVVHFVGTFDVEDGLGDIAFDSAGNLYGGLNPDLLAIDKTTAAQTIVGSTFYLVGGLAFDSNDVLWHAGDSDQGTLDTIDPLDAAVTNLASLAGYAPAASSCYITAVAFDKDDFMYAVDGDYNDSAPYPAYLITIDPTGAKNLVGPTVANLDAIAFCPDAPTPLPPVSGRFVWGGRSADQGGGTYKTTMVSDDGGATWSAVDSPLDNDVFDSWGVLGFTRLRDGRVIQVGINTDFIATAAVASSTSRGSTWTVDPEPLPIGDEGLYGCFTAGAKGVVVGPGDQVVAVGLPGAWVPKTSPLDGDYQNCGAYSPGLHRMVVGGTSNGSVNTMYSDDGGDTWSEGTLFPADVQAMIWIQELGLFVLGTGTAFDHIIYTSPDGIEWTGRGVCTSTDGGIKSFAWSADEGLLMAGLDGTFGPSGIIVTEDPTADVSTWARHGTPLWGDGGVAAIAYGSGRWVACGTTGVGPTDTTPTGGTVAISTNGGRTWARITTPYDDEEDAQSPVGHAMIFLPAPPYPTTPPVEVPVGMVWRFVLCDLMGRPISMISQLAMNKRMVFPLNRPAQLTFDVQSDSPLVNIIYGGDGADEPYLSCGNRTIKVYYRVTGVDPTWTLAFAGPVWDLHDSAENDQSVTSVTCYDPSIYLTKRWVCKDDGTFTSTISIGATSGDQLAKLLVDRTISNYGPCGILTTGTFTTASAQALLELPPATLISASYIKMCDTGELDIAFTPRDAIDGGLAVMHAMPRWGQDRDEVLMAYAAPGRNADSLDRTVSMQDVTNDLVLWPGDTFAAHTRRQDTDSQTKYYVLQDASVETGINDADLLGALADERIALSKAPRDMLTITPVPSNQLIPLRDYDRGDRIQVWASVGADQVFPATRQAISGLQRIYTLTIEVSDDGLTRVPAIDCSPQNEE